MVTGFIRHSQCVEGTSDYTVIIVTMFSVYTETNGYSVT